MGYQLAGAISAPILTAVLDGPVASRSDGLITWKPSKPNVAVGTLEVEVQVGGCSDALLGITLLRARPDRIRMQYFMNGVSVFRLDVNDKHNGWDINTHTHRYVPGDGSWITRPLDDFVHVPFGPTVPRGIEKECFEAFADLVNVQLTDPYWVEPWKEGR